MVQGSEINKLRKIVNRKENDYNQNSNNKYDTYLEFSFYLWHKIHKNKQISTSLAFTIIVYFYLTIVFSIMTIPIEYANTSAMLNVVDNVLVGNSTISIVKQHSSKLDSMLVDIKNLLLFRFLNNQNNYNFLIYAISQIFFIILLFWYKLKNSRSSGTSYMIICMLFYFIYFIFMQPTLDNIMFSSLMCSQNPKLQILCKLFDSTSTNSNATIIISLSSITFVFYYILLYFISCLFFGVNRYSKKDCYNRMSTLYEFSLVNYLYIKTILMIIAYYYEQVVLVILFFNLVYFSSLFYYFLFYIHFYNRTINTLKLILIGICFSSSLIAILCHFVDVYEKSILYITVNTVTGILIYKHKQFRDSEKLTTFRLEENMSIKALESYFDELINLFAESNKDNNRSLYKGIFNFYLRNKQIYKFNKIGVGRLFLPISNEVYNYEMNSCNYSYVTLMNLMYDIYEYSLGKIGKEFDLLISFSVFLNNAYGNSYKTISMTQQALSAATKVTEKLLSYCMIEEFNYKIKENLILKEHRIGMSIDNIYVIFFYEELTINLINLILNLCQDQTRLWKKIVSLEITENFESSTNNPNMENDYLKSAKQIYSQIAMIESTYNGIFQINPCPTFLLDKIYVYYKNCLVEDTDSRPRYNFSKVFDKRLDNYAKLFEDNSFAIIIDISIEVGKVFNYTKNCPVLLDQPTNFMMDKNINTMLPKIIGEYHDHFLKNFQKTGKQNIIGIRDRKVVCKDKNNLAIPGLILVNFLPFLDFSRTFCIGNVQIQPSTEDFMLVSTTGKIDSCNIKTEALLISSYYLHKAEVYLQFIFPELINFTILNAKGKLELQNMVNFNNCPCLIPYLLFDSSFSNKDKNLHIKKLSDHCFKLKTLLFNFLKAENDEALQLKLKEQYFHTVLENSADYIWKSENRERAFNLQTICKGLDIDTLVYGKLTLHKAIIRNNGFVDIKTDSIDPIFVRIVTRFEKEFDQLHIASRHLKLYYVIHQVRNNDNNSKSSSSQSQSEKKRGFKDSCKTYTYASSIKDSNRKKHTNNKPLSLKKLSRCYSVSYVLTEARRVRIIELVNQGMKSRSKYGKSYKSSNISVSHIITENNIQRSYSLELGFHNPIKNNIDLVSNLQDFVSGSKVNAEDNSLKKGPVNEFCFNALNLNKSRQDRDDKSKPQSEKQYQFFREVNRGDGESVSSINSITSRTSHIKHIQKLRKGILSNKQPKLLITLKYLFVTFVSILLVLILYYQIYTAKLSSDIHNITEAIINFDSIPKNLACIHNYARNSYLIDTLNEVYKIDRYDINYMTFSQQKLKACSENISDVLQVMENYNLKNLSMKNTIDFKAYNNITLAYDVINKQITTYDALFYLVQNCLILALHDTEIRKIYNNNMFNYNKNPSNQNKYSQQYNSIFSNSLNNVMTSIYEQGYANLVNFLNSEIDSTYIWNVSSLGLVIVILIVVLVVFRQYHSSINNVETSILNILLDYSNIPYIREKYRKINAFQADLINLTKESLNLNIDEFEYEAEGPEEGNIELKLLLEGNNEITHKKGLAKTGGGLGYTKDTRFKKLKQENAIKKSRERLTESAMQKKRNQSSFYSIAIMLVILVYFIFYFAFILLWNDSINQSNIYYQTSHRNFKNVFYQNLMAFIFIKEYILEKNLLMKDYIVQINGKFIGGLASDNYLASYISSQDDLLKTIKTQIYQSTDLEPIYTESLNTDLCKLVNTDTSKLSDCQSYNGGILTQGLQQVIISFNSNIDSLSKSLSSSTFKKNNFDDEQYTTNERLIDFYLESGYDEFMVKFEVIFSNNYDYQQMISSMLMYVYLAVTIGVSIIIYISYFSQVKTRYTEVLTLLCILPSKSLKNPEVLPQISHLELE